MLQQSVKNLAALGPLPPSDQASEKWLTDAEKEVKSISKPISDEDAVALAQLFGPDDCFGVAWTLLHLIETAPGWPLSNVLALPRNEWIDRLGQRARNAGLVG